MQEEYSSMPEHRDAHHIQNDFIEGSFDISVKDDDIVRTCQVNDKWQEQIAKKLSSQIKQRIQPLLNNKKRTGKQHDFDYEALFSFTSKSFEVFIETQNPKQGECLTLIKNAYELLLKLSID